MSSRSPEIELAPIGVEQLLRYLTPRLKSGACARPVMVMTAHPEFGPIARRILERIDSGEEAATSSLVIAEVGAWLEYHKRGSQMHAFLDAVESYPTLRKYETTYGDELRAQELEPSYPRLEFFDRVYLAQMERLKLTEIYSNDRAFDKVRRVKRVFE